MAINFSKLMKKKGAGPPTALPPPDMEGSPAVASLGPSSMGALLGGGGGAATKPKKSPKKRGRRY